MARPLGRLRPTVVHTHIVRNQSDRGDAALQLIVLHSTEGVNIPNSAQDLIGLGNFFDNPAVKASSNVAVDADGHTARYVRDRRKAWAQAFYNPVALSIEMVGRAIQASWPDSQVDEVARNIAHWSIEYDIPIRRGVVLGGRVLRSGVLSHKALGFLGGGHVDPGAGFPRRRTLRRARAYKAARLAEEAR